MSSLRPLFSLPSHTISFQVQLPFFSGISPLISVLTAIVLVTSLDPTGLLQGLFQKLPNFLTSGLAPLNLSSTLLLGDLSKHKSDRTILPLKTLHWLSIAYRKKSQLLGTICMTICELTSASFCTAFTYQPLPGPLHLNQKEKLAYFLPVCLYS